MNTSPAEPRGGKLFTRRPEPSDKLMDPLYAQINREMPGSASGSTYAGRTDKPKLNELEPGDGDADDD
jgi:hypothetical protein